ncbi:hypothetical protein FS842_003223 [Serendipita sp. 407]|nr:hypothetical protein FS842_003223 [Serendipita sp. 407]
MNSHRWLRELDLYFLGPHSLSKGAQTPRDQFEGADVFGTIASLVWIMLSKLCLSLTVLFSSGTWFSLVASTIFTIFKGHESFVKRRAGGFITAYILIAFFAVLIAGWKFYHPEDHFVNLGRVDLQEGGRDQDLALEERQQLEQDQEHQRQEQHGNGLRRRTNLPWLMGERNGDTP